MKLTDREKVLAFVFLCLLVLTVSYYHFRLKAEGTDEPSFVIESDEVSRANFKKEAAPAAEEGIGSAIYVDIGGAVKNRAFTNWKKAPE